MNPQSSTPSTAGRDVDAQIAEKVMGWKPETRKIYAGQRNVKGWGFNMGLPIGHKDRIFIFSSEMFPHYSTDISAAMEVVKRMKELGFKFRIHGAERYSVQFIPADHSWSDYDEYGDDEPTFESLELAITLAALKAVGADK